MIEKYWVIINNWLPFLPQTKKLPEPMMTCSYLDAQVQTSMKY